MCSSEVEVWLRVDVDYHGLSKIAPLWCELQMYVIPVSFKDNSATSTDNEIIIGPLGPKFSLEGQMQLWV